MLWPAEHPNECAQADVYGLGAGVVLDHDEPVGTHYWPRSWILRLLTGDDDLVDTRNAYPVDLAEYGFEYLILGDDLTYLQDDPTTDMIRDGGGAGSAVVDVSDNGDGIMTHVNTRVAEIQFIVSVCLTTNV
jgi:hypothetical protein